MRPQRIHRPWPQGTLGFIRGVCGQLEGFGRTEPMCGDLVWIERKGNSTERDHAPALSEVKVGKLQQREVGGTPLDRRTAEMEQMDPVMASAMLVSFLSYELRRELTFARPSISVTGPFLRARIRESLLGNACSLTGASME
jgi:hypothetical protein